MIIDTNNIPPIFGRMVVVFIPLATWACITYTLRKVDELPLFIRIFLGLAITPVVLLLVYIVVAVLYWMVTGGDLMKEMATI